MEVGTATSYYNFLFVLWIGNMGWYIFCFVLAEALQFPVPYHSIGEKAIRLGLSLCGARVHI
jgi:hypothetical protein